MPSKKILIIRFSSIGDIVLTSPIIRAIKEQLSDAEVHYVTKKANKDLLIHNPYVKKVHVLENNLEDLINGLRKESFDYIVDLHNNIRSFKVKRALKSAKSFTFDKINIRKWLMVNFKINRLPNNHIVDRYFEAIQKLGVQNDQKGLEYFIPPKDEVDVKDLPEDFQKGYVALVIGAKHFTKRIPVEKLQLLCREIDKPIILLGGKEDRNVGSNVIAVAENQHLYNACGNYNINQSASIIKQAEKVITSDTGLMHIATAFNKEIISIWGNTIPEFGMYPYKTGSQSNMIEVKSLSCRPCSKIGYDKCPKGHFKCMMQNDYDKVIAIANDK